MKKVFTISFSLLFSIQLHAQTWQDLSIPTTKSILSSSFINDNEGWIGTINSGSYAIIYHTVDGGINWNADTITGASGGTSYLEFLSSDLGFAVVNAEAFRTADGGGVWTQMTLPDIPYNAPFFLNEDTGFISGKYAVFKTIDGGITWTSSYMEPTDNIPLYKISFLNDSVGVATDGSESVYTTSDGGDNWYEIICCGLWDWYSSVWYTADGIWITGYEDVFGSGFDFVSGPHGWSNYYASLGLSDVRFFGNNRGYVIGNAGFVLSTENGGYSWTDATITTTSLNVIDGINDIYVFGNNGSGFKCPAYCAAASIYSYTATNLEVEFTDESLNATSWSWDFGDGSTSTIASPAHVYAQSGIYNACLTTSATGCIITTSCQLINVCESNLSLSSAGRLDSTFDYDGILAPDYFGSVGSRASIMVLPDEKIVVGGFGGGAQVGRWNSDGSWDPAFAGDGSLTVAIDDFTLYETALQADGKVVVAGTVHQASIDYIAVARYNADGSLDSTFDSDGWASIDISEMNYYNFYMSFTIQPDGKILVAGYYSVNGKETALVRFNPDGSLDTSFDGDGILNLISLDAVIPRCVRLQADGRIILALDPDAVNQDYCLLRLNVNGSIDSTFDNDGIVFTDFSGESGCIISILVQSDGKIISAGNLTPEFTDSSHFAVARYTIGGSVDSTFGDDGKMELMIGTQKSVCTNAILQSDDRILLTGYKEIEWDNTTAALTRINTDGNIDSTFGNYGTLTTKIDCESSKGYAVALQNDKIYLAGYYYPFTWSAKLFVARYNNSDCPGANADFSYSATGLQTSFFDASIGAASWFWDFGDGNNSTQQSPVHTYNVEGSFSVCLTVTDSCGSNISCQTISVCDPLNTDYLFQATGLSIQFLNQITEATSFSWDFGDGNTSTQQNPIHIFSSSGTYHVCLIEGDACTSDTMCKDLVVCGTVAADFNFTVFGTTIEFNDASTNALNWSWDFGDGNFSSDQNPSHTYSQAGTYTACLVASDDCTNDTMCKSVITGASCNADFMLVADTLNPGFYWGYNLSSGENLIYNWAWGDGTSSAGQYPIHLYADSGFYTICLMINDSIGGCTDTFCADYTILKSSGMLGIHEINFVDYPLNIPSQASNTVEWSVFPNPFSVNTTISFIFTSSQKISMELFDLSGRKVRTVINGNEAGNTSYGEEGNQSLQLSKGNLREGIYFLRLKTESETLMKQLVIQ